MTQTAAWYARRYTGQHGMALVPIEPRRKFPSASDWGNNVITCPDAAEIYYAQNPDWNMGLALGPSGYCSLDIDCEESVQTIMREMGINPADLDEYPTIQGRDKGRRLLFRVPDGADLTYAKLNWPTESGDGKQYTVMELRAACDGKQRQDVLPPSIHPDTGRPYRWIVQPAASHDDWPTPPDWLLVMWQQWDRFKPQLKAICPWAAPEPEPVPAKPRSDKPHQGSSVIDEHLARVPLREALQQYGYKRVGSRRYLSPHTTTKLPGVVLFPSEASCFIHHASDPLCSEETGRPVNSFDLYCEYEHGGSTSEAVRALAKEYGMDSRSSQPRHPDAPAPPPPAEFDASDVPPDHETPEPAPEAIRQPDNPEPDTQRATPYRPFRALGFDGDHYYYLPRGTEQVVAMRRGSHTSPAEMLGLAPFEWWEMAYPKGDKGGTDWQVAASDCMRMCERRGVYSVKNIRGRGAWYDGGSSVLHLGDRLIIDGAASRIADHDSRYIYTRQEPMESTINADPATAEQAKQAFDVVTQLNWSKPVHGWLAAGWAALAPICGALPWRPHLWLAAQRGTGKSWVQDHVLTPLLGSSALVVQGGTTEAGIRQHIRQDARPVMFDEAEAENQRGQMRMQGVLELARQSSSESSAEIIKGTAAGGGMAFRMRSMFLLASINVSLVQAADESRFTVVSLTPPPKDAGEAARFKDFERHVDGLFTREYCASIRARAYTLIPTIRENAATMAQAVAEQMGSQRIGDQFGTLLAGAVSLTSDAVITIEEARTWVSQIDLSDAQEQEEVSDEENCLNAILQHQIRIECERGIHTRTLGEAVQIAAGRGVGEAVQPGEANAALTRHGLVVRDDWLMISNTHNELARILGNTAWAAGWKRVLARLPAASGCENPIRFAGTQTRAVQIPVRCCVG